MDGQQHSGTQVPQRRESPEKALIRKTLGGMAATLVACSAAVAAGRVAGVFDNEPVVILGAMLAVTGAGLWVVRGRFWRVAGHVPIAVLFAVGVYGSATGASLGSYLVLFYALAVLLAGALESQPYAWAVLGASVAVHLGLTSSGETFDTILAVGITMGGCLAGILLIEVLFAGELKRALERTEAAASALAAEVEVRRRAESTLADREQALRAIIDQNSDAMAVTDAAGAVVDWNPAMVALTDVSKEAAVGHGLQDLLGSRTRQPDAADHETWQAAFGAVLGGGVSADRASHRNVLVDSPGRSARTADLLLFRVVGPGGVLCVLSARDVTAQRRLEAERQKASQLESLGLLAGGLAHEFNNVLTTLQGNLSLMRAAASERQPSAEALEQAEASSRRLAEFANRLLTFARGGAPLLAAVPLRECIQDGLGRVFERPDARCRLRLPDDLPVLRADRAQMAQAFEQVLRNADQAMAGQGVVDVSARRVDIGPESGLPLSPGTFVEVEIGDRGPGIPRDIRSRIFDPYFTTKPGANGLGLATTHSVLHRHGGLITVASEPGEGATFHLFVPVDTGAPQAVVAPKPARPAGRRVLLLDDEEGVRQVALRMLRHLGYDAVAVGDGRAAFRAYADAHAAGAPFDVIMVDLTLDDDLNGVESLNLIRQQFPEVTAVVSSGYSSDPVMASYAEHGFKGVVVKPYSMKKLAEVLGGLVG